MSLKSYIAGVFVAVLPFLKDEAELLVKTEVDKYVTPVVAGKIEIVADREIDELIAKFSPPSGVTVTVAPAVPK